MWSNLSKYPKLKLNYKTFYKKLQFYGTITNFQSWEFRKFLSTQKLEIKYKIKMKYNFMEIVKDFKVEISENV